MGVMNGCQYSQYVTTTHSGIRAMKQKLERLHNHATQCRALADSAITPAGREVLLALALDYDERAAILQNNGARLESPYCWADEGSPLRTAYKLH